MRCPTCNAVTLVKETRGNHRRRECFNGHRFSTKETPTILRKQPPAKSMEEAIAFAIAQGREAATGLLDWSEGDTSGWPDFLANA